MKIDDLDAEKKKALLHLLLMMVDLYEGKNFPFYNRIKDEKKWEGEFYLESEVFTLSVTKKERKKGDYVEAHECIISSIFPDSPFFWELFLTIMYLYNYEDPRFSKKMLSAHFSHLIEKYKIREYQLAGISDKTIDTIEINLVDPNPLWALDENPGLFVQLYLEDHFKLLNKTFADESDEETKELLATLHKKQIELIDNFVSEIKNILT